MKGEVLIFLLLFACARLDGQFSRNDFLFVGKRGNVIWDRRVSVFNMGNDKWNAYYAIRFRSSIDTNWKKAGLLGGRLRPFMMDSAERREFSFYRRKKLGSYLLVAASAGSIVFWSWYTTDHMVKTGSLRSYLKPLSIISLASYIVCLEVGKKVNVRGDIFLLNAVRKVNARMKAEKSAVAR